MTLQQQQQQQQQPPPPPPPLPPLPSPVKKNVTFSSPASPPQPLTMTTTPPSSTTTTTTTTITTTPPPPPPPPLLLSTTTTTPPAISLPPPPPSSSSSSFPPPSDTNDDSFQSPLSQHWQTIFSTCSKQQQLLPYQNHSILHCGFYYKYIKNVMRCNILAGTFNQSMRWALEEIFIMSEMSNANNREYKGLITNMINTLKEICIQQVSPRCIRSIVKISKLIDRYQSVSDFSKAVLLMTVAPKSEVCAHLSYVACDKSSDVFQKYLSEKIVSKNDDDQDIELITKNLNMGIRLKNDDINGEVELRQQSVFILGQLYRRKLGLTSIEDLKNVRTKGLKINKTQKIKFFKRFWTRLLAMANVLGGKMQYFEECITFKKEVFEARSYFDDEFLCLVSALESVFVMVRNVQIYKDLLNVSNEEQEKFNAIDWVKNHRNVIAEREEEEEEEEMITIPKINNEDSDWTKVEWKMKFESKRNKRPNSFSPLLKSKKKNGSSR